MSIYINSKSVKSCVAKSFGNGDLYCLLCSHNERFEILDGRPKTIFVLIICCNVY